MTFPKYQPDCFSHLLQCPSFSFLKTLQWLNRLKSNCFKASQHILDSAAFLPLTITTPNHTCSDHTKFLSFYRKTAILIGFINMQPLPTLYHLPEVFFLSARYTSLSLSGHHLGLKLNALSPGSLLWATSGITVLPLLSRSTLDILCLD